MREVCHVGRWFVCVDVVMFCWFVCFVRFTRSRGSVSCVFGTRGIRVAASGDCKVVESNGCEEGCDRERGVVVAVASRWWFIASCRSGVRKVAGRPFGTWI